MTTPNNIIQIDEDAIQKSISAAKEFKTKHETLTSIDLLPFNKKDNNITIEVKVLDPEKASVLLSTFLHTKELSKAGIEVEAIHLQSINQIREDIIKKIKYFLDTQL